jgi:hypothetical protein
MCGSELTPRKPLILVPRDNASSSIQRMLTGVDYSAGVLGFTELLYLSVHRYIERQTTL